MTGSPTASLNRKQRRAAEKAPDFEQALTAHQAGELDRAERLYRKLLAADPRHVSALCNLGLIVFQSGRVDEAARLFLQATRAKPDHAVAHAHLGGAYRELGQLEAAAQSLAAAVALDGQQTVARLNLGMVLRALGRRAESKAQLAAVLGAAPGSVQARYHLAGVLAEEGAYAAAIEHLTEVLRAAPDLADAWVDLGIAHENLGRLDEALACYRAALERNPALPAALFNLAGVLQTQGRYQDAAQGYEQAIAAEPGLVPARLNLAMVMLQLGRPAEAAALYEATLRLAPDHPDALCGLADAVRLLGRQDEALELLERAARLAPGAASLQRGLGELLREAGRFDEAIVRLGEAVRLDPTPLSSWVELGFAKMHAADWDGLEICQRAAFDKLDADQSGAAKPFALLTMPSSPQAQLIAARKRSARFEQAAEPFAPRTPHGRDRLRVGYLSADFRAHATAFLATGLFEAHDRGGFEVIAYSLNPSDGSADRARLETAFDRFVDLAAASHRDAARVIYDDEVDILVDLKGYTGSARPEIVAHRPAPIQVNYLGYPGTMGASFIDYILVDPFIVPPAMAGFYAEKPVWLPVSYQPNMERPIPHEAAARAEHGLPPSGFVFCCFNGSYKITPAVFDVWMRLLRATSGSVLWLLESNDAATRNLRREAAARGVDPERLVFAPPRPAADHLARIGLADLFLDTLPVGAHTTASDALWAGLPLLSCVGESFISRVSGGLLTALGLPELITDNLADYEATALRLASEPAALAALRSRLGEARRTSGLYDPAVIARRLEAAYRQMWRRHAAGEAPAPFSVEA